jgi:hypothetical protein
MSTSTHINDAGQQTSNRYPKVEYEGSLVEVFADGSGIVIPWGNDYSSCDTGLLPKDRERPCTIWQQPAGSASYHLGVWVVADVISFVSLLGLRAHV